MNIVEYADRDQLAIDVAKELAEALNQHLGQNPYASLAVAGGTSPAPIFDDLCAADLDWERISVMASDERWVPDTSDRSNATMIRQRLITDNAKVANFVPFYRDGETPAEALPKVADQLNAHLPLSVVLLGMGEDMHTASLFPGVEGLEQALAADAPILVEMRPDSQPEARVSLSAHILNAALSKHLVIYGEAKKDALNRALSLPPEQAPVQAVLAGMTVHWAP
ncbi:6-phosphogluconolactonase [Epibacterium ulvae]|uniref:6-phosphogluconolactonase n=1 Tax=Epibacterium ulvae TaxID=1156985 RepID=UPI002493CEC5|nr:6-phosphogluconolactonase [Epibacterium ulvae]